MSAQPVLSLEGLRKEFGSVVAVDGVDLQISEGEFLTLLGPSGCGKTTTIRMIGGYVSPSGGRIRLDAADITRTPPQRRNMGMVFQNYALFPHMSVRDNIAYPLKLRGWSRDRIAARVKEMLDLVRLPQIEQRHPSELSGGQQQRVALARALSFSPRLLLMDEALGALDAKLREYMQIEIRRIQQELRITTIHVTHDQEEALGMSDRVVVMRDGRIAQVSTPRELYERPSSAYVADFVGRVNLLPARVVGREDGRTLLDLEAPDLPPPSARRLVVGGQTEHPVGSAVRIGVRPETMSLLDGPAETNCLAGTVQGVRFSGAIEYVTIVVSRDLSIVAVAPSGVALGEEVRVGWPPDRALVLSDDR